MAVREILLKLFVSGLIGVGLCSSVLAETLATIVWYTEQEPGIEPYPVRYIITPEYMRSDEGQSGNDFLLFDRRQRKIYSVAAETRTVLEVDGNGQAPQKPDALSIVVREHVDQKAPMIGGKPPVEVQLVAASQDCHSAMVVAGFLEPVRAAFQEYSQALAVQQVRTLDRTPTALQTPCFLARYLYAGDFALAKGMLLADWNDRGERRELARYETDVPVADTLFVIPADFRRISAAAD
jgi:hypothetical protein